VKRSALTRVCFALGNRVGSVVEVHFGNFNVVAEDVIENGIFSEPIPVRFCASRSSMAAMICFAVLAEVAEFIEFGVKSRCGSCRGRLRVPAVPSAMARSRVFANVGKGGLVDFRVQVAEESAASGRAEGVTKFLRTGKLREGFAEGYEFRVDRPWTEG